MGLREAAPWQCVEGPYARQCFLIALTKSELGEEGLILAQGVKVWCGPSQPEGMAAGREVAGRVASVVRKQVMLV